MKRKFIITLLIASMVSLTLVLAACDSNDDVPPNDPGINHQFEGGVTIPPDAERVTDEEWTQTFEIDENDGGHSFSIGEIIDGTEESEESE